MTKYHITLSKEGSISGYGYGLGDPNITDSSIEEVKCFKNYDEWKSILEKANFSVLSIEKIEEELNPIINPEEVIIIPEATAMIKEERSEEE